MRNGLVVLAALLLCSCRGGGRSGPEHAPLTPAGETPIITAIAPPGTAEKTPFQVQRSGESAISVVGRHFQQGAIITANGQGLTTTFGNAELLTAFVPPDIYAKPGTVAIKVINPDVKDSNALVFSVTRRK